MIGELEQRGGKWVLVAPTVCGNGHVLRGNVSVGTTPCDCGCRHSVWWCRRCEHTTFGPALTPDCRIRTGPDER